MSPHAEQKRSVESHLQDALEAAEHSQTRYHIREALQLTQLSE